MLYELKFDQAPEPTLGIEGKTMKLYCKASKPSGFSGSISFSWSKDENTNIASSTQTTTTLDAATMSTLTVFSISSASEGLYVCYVYYYGGVYTLTSSAVTAKLIRESTVKLAANVVLSALKFVKLQNRNFYLTIFSPRVHKVARRHVCHHW